jgi:hypothetical protein
MKLKQVIEFLGLCPVHLADENVEVSAVYCGDLLSDVLAHIQKDSLWFSIQGHMNVVAVAQLRDVACIVLVNGVAPDPQAVVRARSQGVNICGSDETSAALCMKLAGTL